jgi:hypothetical protein
MAPETRGPIGGHGRTVESDETVIGGKAKNPAYATKEPKRHSVLTLVDRDGDSHSFHVSNVKAKTLRDAMVRVVDRESHLVTDELASYEPSAASLSVIRLSTTPITIRPAWRLRTRQYG